MSRYYKMAANLKVNQVRLWLRRLNVSYSFVGCWNGCQLTNVHAFVITSDESPKDAALHFAKEQGVQLIVVGSRGLSGMQRLLMGSFSNHIVQNAHCGKC